MGDRNVKQSCEEGTAEDFTRGRKAYKAGAVFDVYEVGEWQRGWQYEFDLACEDPRAPQP